MEVSELSKKYFGRQDEAINEIYNQHKKFDNVEIQGSFHHQITHTFSFSGNPNEFVRQSFVFPYEESCGYSNLKIQGTPSNIYSIGVSIGGCNYDKIYPSITGGLDIKLFSDTILLSEEKCPINITVEYTNTNITLNCDCLQITNYDKIDTNYNWVFRSTQYTGQELVTKTQNKVRTNFNHPIYEIDVYLSEKYSGNVFLNLDNLHQLQLEKSNDKHWNLKFSKPVNFSRIGNVTVTFDNVESNIDVNVLCNFYHVATYNKDLGIYCLRFVK